MREVAKPNDALAEVGGVNVHAGAAVPRRDRQLLKVAKGFGLSVGRLLDDNFDEIDEVSAYMRQLPEMEQEVATAVLRMLHDYATGEI
ncbi:hypothetical protein ENSA5_15270 [Enhygromyxa salina]|uniref:Uncharacterized protein n=1 Tax=Enhygromyxa salina TaxID=215803 RepID=A0A2S9YEF0_9BACT|nr:hypothetical protein [Enhygromyxa salina]PRQ03497.1 hypothetical protein ENSA5_15270 [Enhygromyxa salina]